MTHPLPVAGVQMDIAWEDPAESFARARALAERAVSGGARLVVLPEMFATGFSMNSVAMAAHAPAVTAFLSELAVELGVFVAGGFADPHEPRPRNACAVFSPSGAELGRYHKIHPFSLAREDRFFVGGERLVTVEVEGARVTPIICYDLRFSEPFRETAAATDLYLVIANWPEARRHHWRTLLVARAIENQAWVLGVNRVGEGNRLQYAGDSLLVDPLGEVRAAATMDPAVVAGAVDVERVAALRAKYSFVADRRPEVYRGWR